jgi:hypothetical protein
MNDEKWSQENIQKEILNQVKSIGSLLIEKNRKYGNAALKPNRIFSKANTLEQLYVRCDDKINRIMNRQNDEDEDVIQDLIGYLILILVCRKIENNENK